MNMIELGSLNNFRFLSMKLELITDKDNVIID